MQPTFEQRSKVVQNLHTTKYKCKKGHLPQQMPLPG